MKTDATGGLNIRAYANILRRWQALILGITLGAAGIALVVSQAAAPVYEASAALIVGQSQATSPADYNTVLLNEQLARTYSQLLKARPVLRQAAQELNLKTDEATLARLERAINVEAIKDTQLVRIRVRNAKADLAANIANTLLQVFIQQQRASMNEGFASSLQSLEREMQAAQAQISSTQRSLDEEKARPTPDQAKIAQLESLLSQQRSTYEGFQESYNQVRIAQARGSSLLAIFERADPPSHPVLPRTGANVILGALLGAMLSTGVVFFIEYTDDTVKEADDVERSTGLRPVANIARFRDIPSDGPLLAARPGSVAGEGFRLLRTEVEALAAGNDKPAPILLITGTRADVGTTTVVSNLAVSLAQIGRRVLVVDTNLRRPALHQQFGLRNAGGFTSPFLHQAELEQAIQPTRVAGLQVLTAGPTVANPAEVLSFRETRELFDRLRKLADYILLDSPPVLSVVDACVLAHKADGVLLVALAGQTSRADLRRAARVLQRSKKPLLGVVLNGAGETL